MKRLLLAVVTIFLSFILQTTFFQFLALAQVVPNLLLIVTVAYGYMNGEKEGMLAGLACGLLTDFSYGELIGLYALIYMLIGYVNGVFNKIYYTDDLVIPLLLVTVSDFFYNFFYYITEFLLRGRIDLFFYIRRIILPEMVYTVLMAVLLYKLLHTLNRIMKPVEEREA